MNIAEQVEGYIALRDKKEEIRAKYQARINEIDKVMSQVEANLLSHFGETGVDSVRTDAGTAYKETKRQVGTADWDTFLSFVKDNDAWEMLTRKPVQTAVLEWAEDHEDLPPGLNLRSEVTIKIRRSN